MSNFKLSVTGHRPHKLWGYDYSEPHYAILTSKFEDIVRDILTKYDSVTMYSGMAIGTDIVFALTAIKLKSLGLPVKLCCVIPFDGQSSQWPAQAQDLYNYVLSVADEVVYTAGPGYAHWKMQRRNEYLVDVCNKLVAVWDGVEDGGTFNCIEYAVSKNCDWIHINPKDL